MSGDAITWIWLAVGLLLCGAEVFLPGLVSVFLGLAAIAVSILRFVGVIEGLPASFIWWMVTSVVLVLTLRRAAKKWMPAEVSRADIDEDTSAYGREVEVLHAVTPDHADGRIRYQGTSWAARSTEGTLPSGSRARIVYRDGLVWMVEPVLAAIEAEAASLSSTEAVPAAESMRDKVQFAQETKG